jgi:hypothetical protein
MTSLLAQIPSTFLKKEDIPQPVRVQIATFKLDTVGEGDEAKQKMICYFHGMDKGLALNNTNIHILVSIFGDNMEDMVGKSVVLWADPNVSFGGKLVGGLRFQQEQPEPVSIGVTQPVAHDVTSSENPNPFGV